MELPKISPTELAIGAGAVGLGVGLGVGAIVGSRRKKSRKRKATKNKRVRKRVSRGRKHKRIRRTPRTAGKGKDTSHKRIRYTKKGQPYVIMSSGKARFIKKSSAKQSHKRKGGRY